MDDFQNIEEEYKYLERTLNLKLKNIRSIYEKILGFQTSMTILKDVIVSVPDLSNSPFYFMDDLFKDFINLLETDISLTKERVLDPLDKLINNFKFVGNENLETLNKMKNSLFNEKKNLNDKRNKYLNFTSNNKSSKDKNNKNNLKNDEDEKIFNDAVKANSEQLYQYELDKMNEIIEENNAKYKNIYEELNALNSSSIIDLKKKLISFADIIKNFSDIFNNLSSEINNKIKLSENLKDNVILKLIETNNQKIQFRFKNDMIDNSNNTTENSEIKNEIIEINNKNKCENNKLIQIVNLEIESEKEETENFIKDIINKFFNNEEEIKTKNITKLFIIFKKENNKTSSFYCQFFLDTIQIECKNKIIFIKNYKNFIHISNILNDLCLNHEEILNIFYIIIDISQKICFKKKFLSNILREKNEFFKTKVFWIKLIDEHLMETIKVYIKKILNKKEQKEKKNIKNKIKKEEENKEEKEKEKEKKKENEEETNFLKKYLKKKDLYKNIKEYKKLNKIQIKELEKLRSTIIFDIMENLINSMISFIENKKIIEEIIKYYRLELNLNENKLIYLYKKIKFNFDVKAQFNSYNNDLSINNNIIITSVCHYLPFNEFPNLLKLNKQIYENYKDNIYIEAFSDSKTPIKIILKFWYKNLKIKESEENYIYENIKSGINLSIFQNQIKKGTKQLKSMEIIEQDIKRTFFISKNPTHYDSFKSIMNCILLTFPQIGYCQGMNCIVSFFYQLLDRNEVKTFHYLCGLELNTNYHEIFEDDFNTLKIYFNVFSYLLNIFKPDIYYKLKNNNLVSNCYATSWFITLFTENVEIINKDSPPLLSIFIFNRFIFEGWTAVFNLGLVLMELAYEKIMKYKNEKLFSYVMNIINEENIFDNKNFEICKTIYLKNTKIINKSFIDKIIEIEKLNI